MRKTYGVITLALATAFVLVGAMAPSAYHTLDERGDPLRATFNADIGKVRVLMLVAPT